jgi:hypothetical protein
MDNSPGHDLHAAILASAGNGIGEQRLDTIVALTIGKPLRLIPGVWHRQR